MMKPFYLLFLINLLIFTGCKDQNESEAHLAQAVIDEAIKVAGGEQFKNSVIAFDFRGRHYRALRDRWKFQFERIWKDSANAYRDVLSNIGFQRYVNDSMVAVPDTMAVKYTSSINAVHYFSILPYGLNDKAVNKTYLGQTEIKGKPYHKIKITFDEEGGGEDYEDIFVYWIHTSTYEVDYLSYSYEEAHNDVGLRFRESYNRRGVNGLYFSDHNNYKPKDGSATVYNMDSLFMADRLQILSKIELQTITVDLLPTTDR